ncbi:MAG: serine hydrolase domain-containing protein [Candidatus Promineifilaceae bacterium]
MYLAGCCHATQEEGLIYQPMMKSVMRILNCSLLTSSGRLLTQTTAQSSPAKPASEGTSYAIIDAYIENQMRHLHIPGLSLAIVDGDRVVHLRGFGTVHPNGVAPVPQTPFFIGSLTKSFTALAVIQLVEAGKVELNAPVQRYLPWFKVADPVASGQITVRHLLNQTSGLPGMRGMADLGNMDGSPGATERQIRALSTVKLIHLAGSKFEYSNTNYNILGLIIESASGEPYADYVQKHIFNPLDMSHSYSSKVEARQNGLAVGHRYWFGFPYPAPNLLVPLGSLPSGQLISSAEDMAHYLIANLNGGSYRGAPILSADGIAKLHRGVAEIREMGFSLGHYGMGWISQERGESTIISHSGIVPDFGAFMALVPELKKGFVILYNVNHAMLKLTFDELGMGVAQLLAGEYPKTTILSAMPWVTRSMLFIPFLQLASILTALRLFGRERRQRITFQKKRDRMRRPRILFPFLINLVATFTLIPRFGKMRGFYKLFMPDFAWIALACGFLAGIWTFLHTILVLQDRRNTTSRVL